jgi:DNA polymerase III delta prime subunit
MLKTVSLDPKDKAAVLRSIAAAEDMKATDHAALRNAQAVQDTRQPTAVEDIEKAAAQKRIVAQNVAHIADRIEITNAVLADLRKDLKGIEDAERRASLKPAGRQYESAVRNYQAWIEAGPAVAMAWHQAQQEVNRACYPDASSVPGPPLIIFDISAPTFILSHMAVTGCRDAVRSVNAVMRRKGLTP